MERIPIAEEFLDQWFAKKGYVNIDEADDLGECLIEFAQSHLRKQTETILKKLELRNEKSNIIKNIVSNAYPLNNIK